MLLVEVEYVGALLEVNRQNAVESRMCLRWWMVCSYADIYSIKQVKCNRKILIIITT